LSGELLFKTEYPGLFQAHFDAAESNLQFTEELKFPNSFYRGYLKGKLPHGPGVQIWSDGDRYECQWADGQRNGAGRLIFADGAVYDGNFKDGLKDGRGVHTWPNGKRYEGEYENNLFHGNGVFTYPNGDQYDGQLREGKEHGEGVERKNGKERRGRWENGKLVDE
jgi:hypothetical protein